MHTIEETRRLRLRLLVDQHGGMANLCQALGYARNETAKLTRILNANVRHEREGALYNMGSPMAREIEQKLSLEVGWMDNPVTPSDLDGAGDPRAQAYALMNHIPPSDWPKALRLLAALGEPAEGTNGKPQ